MLSKNAYCSSRETAWNPSPHPACACSAHRITVGTSPYEGVSLTESISYIKMPTFAGGLRTEEGFDGSFSLLSFSLSLSSADLGGVGSFGTGTAATLSHLAHCRH